MGKPVIITADSSADLPAALRAELGIHFIPLLINLEGKFYKDCVDLFPKDIYTAYKERGVIPKTAAPSIGEYKAFFETWTSQGCAVVHLSLSHQLSSVNHVAQLAAAECEDVHVVDTMNFCVASGMLCVLAAKLREQGLPAEEIARELCRIRSKVMAYYIPDNLVFVSKGGRCSALTAFGANLLKLRPMVTVNGNNGDLNIGKKYRGSLATVQENFLRDAIEASRDKMDLSLAFVVHTPDMTPEQYEPLEALARELLPDVQHWVTSDMGCVIVSHVGNECFAFIAIEKD
ncbi:MAG: DegV family protein [Oscillospiraceae bacterium]|jgi:DegV family protein with EDD domain|nr:DegV family protein [Oscillospiraceae bacterium]